MECGPHILKFQSYNGSDAIEMNVNIKYVDMYLYVKTLKLSLL